MLRNFCVLVIGLITYSMLQARPVTMIELVSKSLKVNVQDTTEDELTDAELKKFEELRISVASSDTIHVEKVKLRPFSNIADFVKGEMAGLYVQQPSGESGVAQNIVIRGAGVPIFDNTALNNVRPAIFVNGVPMVSTNNFAYDMQTYKFNRIGPETDFLNFVDVSSIQSIEVVKDPARLAVLGPLAANGAILITTIGGRSGDREISFNSYYGFNQKPAVTPINAQYEDMFRQPFYALYNNTVEARQVYPGFLADSTNMNYYGASRWQDEYYRNAALYSVDLSLKGGSDRANFGFLGGHTRNASTADQNNLNRYNALFNVNMLPFKWFTVSAYVHVTRTDRDRNRNLRDRYAEMGYLPDLSTPLAPNLGLYRKYLNQHERAVDDNVTNSLQGNLALSFDILPKLNYTSSFMVDYFEGIRDVFYPSELMETTNYLSNYYGYSQRYAFNNRIKYSYDINDQNTVSLFGGVDYLDDLYRYSYGKAFDGPNDFVKLNVVEGDPNEGSYLTPQGGLNVYRWYNTDYNRLLSVYGRVGYTLNSFLDVNAVVRWDGSSAIQPNNRWLFTPSASVKWNLDKHFDMAEEFSIKLSGGRIGRIPADTRLAVGPQYSTNLNWSTESNILSYYGNAALSRPYNRGWVGYDLGWAYVDQLDLTVQKSLFHERLNLALSFYQKEDKDQVALIPVPEEYGYVGQFKNGLDIRNRGVDFNVAARILGDESRFNWSSRLNFNLNKNEVTGLPDGLTELIVGDRLLQVGQSADAFWVYQNAGIYSSTEEVPAGLNFEGIPFSYGDPKWVDQNKDQQITPDDKVLTGNSLPKFFGGFSNRFAYKNFDLNVDLVFAVGHKTLNQRAATRYNFINNEANNSITSIREIFHWQQDVDITKYPQYNVWSDVDPYRVDQDLFLEDASYLKIQGVSLGYNLSDAYFLDNVATLRRAYIFATVNNLFTFTKFSGSNPELININGYYDGYGLPLTPTYSIGFKLDL